MPKPYSNGHSHIPKVILKRSFGLLQIQVSSVASAPSGHWIQRFPYANVFSSHSHLLIILLSFFNGPQAHESFVSVALIPGGHF